MYEVVHVKTQEEWDIVSEIMEYNWSNPILNFNTYKNENCINLEVLGYAKLSYYQLKNSIIHSFEDWYKTINPKQDIITDTSYLIELFNKYNIT